MEIEKSNLIGRLMAVANPSPSITNRPCVGRDRGPVTQYFGILVLNHVFGMGDNRHFTFRVRIATDEY